MMRSPEIQARINKFDSAKNYLEKLINLDPDYKSGEASLLYGKALYKLQDWQAAKEYLKEDIRYWSHPESSVLLATIYKQEGETQSTRDCLKAMITKVKASPIYHYRRHQHIVRKAEKLLKSL